MEQGHTYTVQRGSMRVVYDTKLSTLTIDIFSGCCTVRHSRVQSDELAAKWDPIIPSLCRWRLNGGQLGADGTLWQLWPYSLALQWSGGGEERGREEKRREE